MPDKKIALVLSGGGAKGAFQMAAERYARKQMDYKWSVIAGVSVGALNAVMLGMEKYTELEKLWETITKDKIMTGKLNLFTYVKLLFGKKSIYGNKPLKKLIDQEVDPERIKIPVKIGAVSLKTGLYQAFKADHFGFRELVLSSTAIPIVWEPVQVSNLYQEMVDGGLRNISPLGDVIDEDPDEVVIINCSPREPHATSKPMKRILDIAMRTVDIMTNEIFINDVREFLRINMLVKQAEASGCKLHKADGREYKYFECKIIEPREDLGDTLDFSADVIAQRIRAGEATAREVLG